MKQTTKAYKSQQSATAKHCLSANRPNLPVIETKNSLQLTKDLKTKNLKRPLRLGILGGGQLARMLALKAHPLGIEPWVLTKQTDDPAAQVTKYVMYGDWDNSKDLKKFLAKVDLVTFESEFINARLLQKVSQQTTTKVLPQPQIMAKLQDRLWQKHLLDKFNLPNASYRAVTSPTTIHNFLRQNKAPVVLKKRHGGYDGYGTFVIDSSCDLAKYQSILTDTCGGFIVEKLIKFRRELALIAVRNPRGQIHFLPLVETYQQNSRCLWVKGPIYDKRILLLQQKIGHMLTAINYAGVIAFELFDCSDCLLINEVAPRVHNSAHFSLDALDFDQFSLHILAVTNQNIVPPKLLSPGFAMLNLLGTKQGDLSAKIHDIAPPFHLHWYGKSSERDQRKMGHINVNAATPDKALQLLKQIEGVW